MKQKCILSLVMLFSCQSVFASERALTPLEDANFKSDERPLEAQTFVTLEEEMEEVEKDANGEGASGGVEKKDKKGIFGRSKSDKKLKAESLELQLEQARQEGRKEAEVKVLTIMQGFKPEFGITGDVRNIADFFKYLSDTVITKQKATQQEISEFNRGRAEKEAEISQAMEDFKRECAENEKGPEESQGNRPEGGRCFGVRRAH